MLIIFVRSNLFRIFVADFNEIVNIHHKGTTYNNTTKIIRYKSYRL